jgi:hypothetical protein
MKITTWIDEMHKDGVKVCYDIVKLSTDKSCSSGYFNYTMVSLATGRAELDTRDGLKNVIAFRIFE